MINNVIMHSYVKYDNVGGKEQNALRGRYLTLEKLVRVDANAAAEALTVEMNLVLSTLPAEYYRAEAVERLAKCVSLLPEVDNTQSLVALHEAYLWVGKDIWYRQEALREKEAAAAAAAAPKAAALAAVVAPLIDHVVTFANIQGEQK